MQERDREEDVGKGAEDEESPFVGGGYERAREPAGNPDPGEGDVVDDGGPAYAGEEADGGDEWCPADEPVLLLVVQHIYIEKRRFTN